MLGVARSGTLFFKLFACRRRGACALGKRPVTANRAAVSAGAVVDLRKSGKPLEEPL
jgi:hypothetical protein